jgi:hypothetical protein
MVCFTTQELPIAPLASHKSHWALAAEQMPATVNAQAAIDELLAVAHEALPQVDNAGDPDGVKGFLFGHRLIQTPIQYISECPKAQHHPIDRWHNR